MSEPTRTRRAAPAKPRGRPALVTSQRKREIAGLMLMTVALLLLLAFISYTPDDSLLVARHTTPTGIEEDARIGTPQNLIGRVGAWLAYWCVERGIGYVAVVGCGLLFAWGYALLRHRPKYLLGISTLFLAAAALLVSALGGWFAGPVPRGEQPSEWAGGIGAAIAGWLSNTAGRPGAFIVLLLLLVVVALVFVERDIQGAVDRVEGSARSIADRVRSLAARMQASRDARAASNPGDAPVTRTRPRRAAPAPDDGTTQEHGDGQTQRRSPGLDVLPPPFEAPAFGATPGVGAAPAFGAPPAFDVPGLPPLPGAAAPVPSLPRPKVAEPAADEVVMQITQATEERRVDRLDPLEDTDADAPAYAPPTVDLLDAAPENARAFDPEEIEENKQILLDKLETYRIKITAINAIVGPTVTLYELTPAPGIKISRITALEDDLAMAMAATGIRIIAPIPGKGAIGVEIPNRRRQMVRMRDVIATETFKSAKMALPFPIGKSIEGETAVEDLAKMPHVLIAGATGSGKSVGLNTLICGLLYRCPPSHLKFVFIDPKKIELTPYGRLREHFIAMPENYDEPVVTDFSMALGVLKSCEKEMERRYDLLAKAQVRGIADYNKKVADGTLDAARGHRHLPYIVVVVDELADLMMTAGKEIEGPIARLAQMARAIGIHLVLATQRPSVDVITGLIKANFPSRIAYQVASKIDSRTILDQGGAEQLVGNGDLLYMNGSRMVRLQGPYVSGDEVERVTEAICSQDGPGPYILPSFADDGDDPMLAPDVADRDDLFETAARVIVTHQQGSVSLLQRKLGIGYGRAARIVDQLERAGVVGRAEGAQKARAVLVQTEQQLDSLFNGSGGWDDGE